MDKELERAIEILAGKITQSIQPDQALKFTQAALNLAHVLDVLDVLEMRTTEVKARGRTKGASAS